MSSVSNLISSQAQHVKMFGRYHGSQGRWKSWVNVVACGSTTDETDKYNHSNKNLEVENIFSVLFVYILNFTIFEAYPTVLDGLPLVFFLISGHQKCGMTSEPDVLSSAVHKSISKRMSNMSWGGKLTHRRLRLPKVPKYLPQVPKKRITLHVYGFKFRDWFGVSTPVTKPISEPGQTKEPGRKLMSTYELYDEICRICWWLENICFLW